MPAAVPLKIDLGDGKRHVLKFGITAHSAIEQTLHLKKPEDLLDYGVGATFVQTALWAGLLWKDRSLTLEEVGDMIDAYCEGAPGRSHVDLVVPLLEAFAESRGIKVPAPNGHDPAGGLNPNAAAEARQPVSSPNGGTT